MPNILRAFGVRFVYRNRLIFCSALSVEPIKGDRFRLKCALAVDSLRTISQRVLPAQPACIAISSLVDAPTLQSRIAQCFSDKVMSFSVK